MTIYAEPSCMKTKPVTYKEVKHMGAFKNKTTMFHINENDKTYFFSTDHMQETGKEFVPMTLYYASIDEIRKDCKDHGYKEIDNPDPDFKP